MKVPASRREQDDRRLGTESVNCLEKRLGLHHHPRPAPVRVIVDRLMPIVRIVAEVHDVVLHRAGITRARENARRKRSGEKLRKDRDDVDAQHYSMSPSTGSTSMTRCSESTRVTVCSLNGSSTVLPPARFT